MTQRIWKLGAAATGLLALAALFRFPPEQYPFYPPCPFHQLTGLLCPGCGATRALAALLHGHLHEAWHWNALFVTLLPLALGYVAVALRRDARGREWPSPTPALICLLLGTVILFTVARNVH